MTTRSNRRRVLGDRGAALTELALVLPILVLLFAGVVDFGFAWKDSLTIGTGAQAGARIGANVGSHRAADEEAIIAVASAVASIGNNVTIEHILVFKPDADGEIPSACFGGGNPTSKTGLCNHYTVAQMADVLAGTANFGTFGNTCSGGALDRHWCPLDREDRQLVGADEIGVYIEAQRGWSTGVFPGNGLTIARSAIMRLEPPTA
ncbi:MAG: pilus assembly protein [Actinomycetia bacterium]|nr:pilus assembly protein [Actinomycetes bacterium]